MERYWTDFVVNDEMKKQGDNEQDDIPVYKADEVDDEKVAIRAAYNAEVVVLDARIRELVEENEKLDTECTKRQLEIYRLQEALEKHDKNGI